MKKNLVTAILVIIIVIGGGYFLLNKSPESKMESQSKLSANQVTKEENLEIPGVQLTPVTSPTWLTYKSEDLGVKLEYPKFAFYTKLENGTQVVYELRERPFSVTEDGNKLIASWSNESYYAEIYHKNSNESFEESILRHMVEPEYRNNPCTVESYGNNKYGITFPGDADHAAGWTEEGIENDKKCGGQPYTAFTIYTDPITGGFYIATKGVHDPAFYSGSELWWPVGITFFQ